MLEKIPTGEMSREEWLAERRRSLGGSDVGAVLGLNPYASPYSVWAEKTGRLPEKEDTEAMRQGRDLEEYVAARFSEKSGKKVQRYNYLLRNTEFPFLHANIDRRILGESSGLECKTASALRLRAFSGGEFPESYYAQCAAYLAVTGWQRWYLAALVLNRAFYIYQITTVPEDEKPAWCESSVYVSSEELDTLKRAAAEFWEEYVRKDTPPPADGSETTEETMQAIYADENGGEIELFGREALLDTYITMAEEKEALQTRMDAIKQTIQEDMGENTRAWCGDYQVTWKAQERRSFDAAALAKAHPELDLSPYYKTTASRVFRLKQLKEEK